MENIILANLSVLFFCSVLLLASMASVIFCWMVKMVSLGLRYIFSVVSSGEPSARFFRMTKETQKWLRSYRWLLTTNQFSLGLV